MLSKMGTGRLSQGQQLMAPLPQSWTKLSQHLAAKRQQASQSTPHTADTKSDGPARPLSADIKGRHQKAEVPSRPIIPDAQGRLDRPEPSARPLAISTNGRQQKAEDPSRPVNPATKERPDGPEPSARPSAAGTKGRQQTMQGSSKPPQPGATSTGDQAHGLANGKIAEPTGKDEKAKAMSNGQKRPAWGAAQPASNAARVVEARTFKVGQKGTTSTFPEMPHKCHALYVAKHLKPGMSDVDPGFMQSRL